MVDIEELIVRIKAAGVEQVSAALAQVEARSQGAVEGVRKTGAATKEASHEFGLFRSPVLEALFAVRAFTTEIRETVAALGELSGVKVAAEYAHIQAALDNVTGSAKAAKEMMEQIENLNSPYLNTVMMSAVPQIINAGTPASQAVGQLKDLTNIAAMGALTNQQLPGFIAELTRMRGMDHPELRSLAEFGGIPIMRLVNKGAGTHFQNANQANDYLQTMTGEQAYELLLKGSKAVGDLALKTEMMRDPALALAKGMEDLEDIFKATGDLLLPILGYMGYWLDQLFQWLKNINDLTHGLAGIQLILLVVIKYWRILSDTFLAGIRFTRQLTSALENYAEAAGAATKATEMRTIAEGGAAKGATIGADAAKGISPGLRMIGFAKGLPEAIRGMKWADLAPKLAGAALKFGPKMLDVATLGADFGLETLGAHMKDAHGNQTKAGAITAGIGNGIGWGGMGMLLGPEIGIPAAIIGAIVGGGMAAHNYHNDSADRQVDAVNKNTEALTKLSGKMVGGGERSRRVIGQIEVEYSVARMIAQGVA